MTGNFRCPQCGGKSLIIGPCTKCHDTALLRATPPEASDEAWRMLIWAFVRFITEGGPETHAALTAAKRDMQERAKG